MPSRSPGLGLKERRPHQNWKMWRVSLNSNLSDNSLPLNPVGKDRTEMRGLIKDGDHLFVPSTQTSVTRDSNRLRQTDPLVGLVSLRGGALRTKTRTW